ncbi:BnaC02g25730D [Brassica napus]|uniref:BnaC02g25730D protein n=1 Tax=Brassica napus TaxID=3708 RepID=A0A078GA62_BRANA|nr:BnaC02g25730D [Brassica napus]
MLVSLARPTLLVSDLTAAAQSLGVLRRFWSDGEVVAARGVVLVVLFPGSVVLMLHGAVVCRGLMCGVSSSGSQQRNAWREGEVSRLVIVSFFFPCGSALQQALPRAGSGPLGLSSVGFVVAPVQISFNHLLENVSLCLSISPSRS